MSIPDPHHDDIVLQGEDAVRRQRAEVRGMFDKVSPRYDLLNRLLSIGMDGGWRRAAIRASGLAAGDCLLDVACGTGDMMREATRRVPGCRVIGVDFAREMLRAGRGKWDPSAPLAFIHGDAESLPVRDGTCAAATMSFGIRNIPRREAALCAMARAVKPGGRIAILELSTKKNGFLAFAVGIYVRTVLPLVGGALSRGEAYGYLSDSMHAFPDPARFCEEMRSAGLVNVKARRLFLSPAWLFVGTVAPEV